MTAKTKITLLSVAALTVLLLVAGYARAEATKTSVEGAFYLVLVGEPERYWVDEEGIEHYRGLPFVFVYDSGDLEGWGSGVVNINLDPMGNGDQSGSYTSEITWGDLTGTFRGHLSGTVRYGIADCGSVSHGTSGDVVGMKVMMAYTLDYATLEADYQAIILEPQGD